MFGCYLLYCVGITLFTTSLCYRGVAVRLALGYIQDELIMENANHNSMDSD